MLREEVELLAARGIHPAMSFDACLAVEYVGMTGEMEDAQAWRRDFGMAMDAQPTLITAPNQGIPAFLTNLIDPQVIRVLVAPMKAAEIFGETKKGDWTLLSTQFPVVESTGGVTSYGDFNNNGNNGVNVNWVARQSYHYQTVSRWGERDLEMFGLAKINYASEINVASALNMSKFQNKSYFFGVAGLANYGGLNDPSLSTPISPGPKAGGGTSWALAIAAEIYTDILSLFTALQTQMAGLVPDMDAKMTLSLSPFKAVALNRVSTYNVTAKQTIMENFPNLTIKTAPEYSTQAGELMQLKLDNVEGVETTYAAFTEKMRAHPVIPDISSWKQKKSGGTWGTIIRRPICIVQMLGI